MKKGRKPAKMLSAARLLAVTPGVLFVPSYTEHRAEWRRVADLARSSGIFSKNTSTIDIPVARIVATVIAIRQQEAR